ncbi:MAG: glycosyltransferase family protein [Planctomycetes bacterium]|nr:glycosyltransferase family protein [Planctomycetota bacterium]
MPDDSQVRFSLGNVLKLQERWSDAEVTYRECTDTAGFETEWTVSRAFVLAKLERLDEAAELYRKLLREQPEFAEIHSSLSFIHERQGRLAEATASARMAVELKPDYADGFNNLGIALRSQHRLDESRDAFRQALRIQAEFPLAEFNLGTTHLLAGDYPQGWPGYEKRGEAVGDSPREFDRPRWDGKPIPHGRLFVFTDQGFGDAIQFARFLTEAKHRSQAQVILECQPELTQLFTGLNGVDELLAADASPPECDTWISLASLPGLFGVTLDSIPANSPYLCAPAEMRSELQTLISTPQQSGKKIGFVWQGNPQQARDVVRSCSLETFAPLLEMDGITAFSLQTGDPPRLPQDRSPIDLGTKLQNFAETAAVIQQLDLLISVDTAAAHLAGAMGTPVWTLLCHTPDWRWGLTGDTSPWYPSMRLFRQPKWGDWNSVIAAVQRAMENELPAEK